MPDTVTYVGATSGRYYGDPITPPSGNAGDLLVAVLSITQYSGGASIPSGWTVLLDHLGPAGWGNQRLTVAYRFATGSTEPAHTWVNAYEYWGWFVRLRGATTPRLGPLLSAVGNSAWSGSSRHTIQPPSAPGGQVLLAATWLDNSSGYSNGGPFLIYNDANATGAISRTESNSEWTAMPVGMNGPQSGPHAGVWLSTTNPRTTAQQFGYYSGSEVNTGLGVMIVVAEGPTAPTTPVLTGPADSTTLPLNSTSSTPFTWTTTDVNPGQGQAAYAFRRQRAGYPDQWWNGTDFVNTETYVASTTPSVTFPTGKWPVGTYTWSVRVRDADNLTTAYSAARTITSNSSPTAPTLAAPANGSIQNLAATPLFDWTVNDPDTGDSQSAWAMRRKVSGASQYEYWNVGSGLWQSTEVYNASTADQYTFPSGKWTNGLIYNWSVATKDSLGVASPYATDATVTSGTAPTVTVTAPTGTVSTTSRPVVTWSYSDAENDPQVSYRVRIFTAAQYGIAGFDPATSPATYDSGEVSGAAIRSQTPDVDLENSTTYRAYVRSTQSGNQTTAWAFSAFSTAYAQPNAPTLAGSFDGTEIRAVLTVTNQNTGPQFTASNTTVLVEFSDDAGTTWQTLRNASAVPFSGNTATVYDTEIPPTATRRYRAKVQGVL